MRIDQWTKFIDMAADDREAEEILRTGDTSQIATMAQARGFDFTEQDIEDAKLNTNELNQSELEEVAGGSVNGANPPFQVWNRLKNTP